MYVYLSIYLSIHPSIDRSIDRSIYLSIYLSLYIYICMYICENIYAYMCIYRYTVCFFRLFQHPERWTASPDEANEANEANCTGPWFRLLWCINNSWMVYLWENPPLFMGKSTISMGKCLTPPIILYMIYIWWFTLWLWLTVRHGFSMALIEIDGLPNLKMVMFHGYVSHNQMVCHGKSI